MFNRNLFAHIEKNESQTVFSSSKARDSSLKFTLSPSIPQGKLREGLRMTKKKTLKASYSTSKINGRLSTSVPIASTIRQQDKYILFRKVLSYTRSSFLLVLLTLALFFTAVFTANASEITHERLFELVNQARISQNLSPLRLNEHLTQAATNKAFDMLTNSYFAHTSPTGIDPWGWIKQANYNYELAGENLAMDFVTAEGMHRGLMKSDSHRANILNPRYEDIGIGVVKGTFENRQTIIAVQLFGRNIAPKSVPNGSMTATDSELKTNRVQFAESPFNRTVSAVEPLALSAASGVRSISNNGSTLLTINNLNVDLLSAFSELFVSFGSFTPASKWFDFAHHKEALIRGLAFSQNLIIPLSKYGELTRINQKYASLSLTGELNNGSLYSQDSRAFVKWNEVESNQLGFSYGNIKFLTLNQDGIIDLAIYFSLLINLTILSFYLFRIVIETITQEIFSWILYLLASHKFLLKLTNGTRFVMRLFL